MKNKGCEITFEKSVPAATAAVRRVQRSWSPLSNSSRQRAVWSASSLDGASMTALGPLDSPSLPSDFPDLPLTVSEVLYATLDALCSVEEISEGLERLLLGFEFCSALSKVLFVLPDTSCCCCCCSI